MICQGFQDYYFFYDALYRTLMVEIAQVAKQQSNFVSKFEKMNDALHEMKVELFNAYDSEMSKITLGKQANENTTRSHNVGCQLNSTRSDRICKKLFGYENYQRQLILVSPRSELSILYKDRNFKFEVGLSNGFGGLGEIEIKIGLYTADDSSIKSLEDLLVGEKTSCSDKGEWIFKKLKIKEKSSDFIYHKFTMVIYPRREDLLKMIKPLVLTDIVVKSKKTSNKIESKQ